MRTQLSREIRWNEILRAMRVMGHMDTYSKNEIWRVRRQLIRMMNEGIVEQTGRGVYRLARGPTVKKRRKAR